MRRINQTTFDYNATTIFILAHAAALLIGQRRSPPCVMDLKTKKESLRGLFTKRMFTQSSLSVCVCVSECPLGSRHALFMGSNPPLCRCGASAPPSAAHLSSCSPENRGACVRIPLCWMSQSIIYFYSLRQCFKNKKNDNQKNPTPSLERIAHIHIWRHININPNTRFTMLHYFNGRLDIRSDWFRLAADPNCHLPSVSPIIFIQGLNCLL